MAIAPYSGDIEQIMKRYYESLSEKDRRRYAAIEALKLGYGGKKYIMELLGCHYRTIVLGIQELKDEGALSRPSIRVSSRGRKTAWETFPSLDAEFLAIINNNEIKFASYRTTHATTLSRFQIRDRLAEVGIKVSTVVVDKLMLKHKVYRCNHPLKELQVV